MKLKRIAARTAVFLIVLVGLCMFFGQTVLTLTTPKVKLVDAQIGKLEDKIKVSAELYFANPQSYTVGDARDIPVVIDKVWVSPGDEVKEGDTLFTCYLQSKYEEDYEKALESLKNEQAEALKTELENAKVSTKNTTKNDAEALLIQKQDEYTEALVKLTALAAQAGVVLSESPERWKAQLRHVITPEMTSILNDLEKIGEERTQAQADFMEIHTKGRVNANTYNFLKKREDHLKKIEAERKKLLDLVNKAEGLKIVRAPRDGVVVKVDVKEGESYSGDKAAYQLSVAAPVLRADITEERKDIVKDMRVEYKSDYETLRTTIVDIQRDGSKRYALMENTEEIMNYAGGLRALSERPIDVSIIYRSRANATLLAASAVRGEDNANYVFVAEERYGFWGTQLIARKVDVRVVDRASRGVAIEEDLSYQKIITQENAFIDAGSRVMEYIN